MNTHLIQSGGKETPSESAGDVANAASMPTTSAIAAGESNAADLRATSLKDASGSRLSKKSSKKKGAILLLNRLNTVMLLFIIPLLILLCKYLCASQICHIQFYKILFKASS